MDPDEAHYAQLTREMLRAGNWMIPLLDGLPYIDKPVLFHWLAGAGDRRARRNRSGHAPSERDGGGRARSG